MLASGIRSAVVVFGDDGEKFGTWPDTKKHVYDDGWLRATSFNCLMDNRDWLQTTTLAREPSQTSHPLGKIYLPEGSYREMTEWALPTGQQQEYERCLPRYASMTTLARDQARSSVAATGGISKCKYPETDEMYTRMMPSAAVWSRPSATASDQRTLLESARTRTLSRPVQLQLLARRVWRNLPAPLAATPSISHLIAADNLLRPGLPASPYLWVEATADDCNFDGSQEVRLENDQLVALLNPARRAASCTNWTSGPSATICWPPWRDGPEAYHRKVLAGPSQPAMAWPAFTTESCSSRRAWTSDCSTTVHPRKSLLDHFYAADVSSEPWSGAKPLELGDFALQDSLRSPIRRNPERIQVMMDRVGQAEGIPLTITKGVTLEAGSSTLEIAYMLEGLPARSRLAFWH